VPLIGIGEGNPDPEVFTMLENESRATALGPLVGVEATALKRDGVCCEFSEFLVTDRLTKGDLKGFVKEFPVMPEVDDVCTERLLSALGVEKYAADRKVPPPSA
jgi:hypothetical protein